VAARFVLGFDPGKEGGLAALTDRGAVALLLPLPYAPDDDQPLARTMRAAVRALGGEVVAAGVELVNSFGMGRQSAFVFGQGVGALVALCELEGWPVIRVRPQSWQATIGATRKGGAADPLGPVSRLFPTANLLATPRSRKPHYGLVDALGIAEHTRRLAATTCAAEDLPFG
jgi:hypothetical protein